LSADSAKPAPPAFHAVNPSIMRIQPGTADSSPTRGRARHCFTAAATASSPTQTRTTFSQVPGSLSPRSIASPSTSTNRAHRRQAGTPGEDEGQAFRRPSLGTDEQHDGDDRNREDRDRDREREDVP
jgi:hypothetical protein